MTFYSAAVLGFGVSPKQKLTCDAQVTLESVAVSHIASSEFCRICYDISVLEPVVSLCKCKGTVGLIHTSCLEHWLEESGRDACELCGEPYPIARMLRYGVAKGLFMWFCRPGTRNDIFGHIRSVRSDLAIFSVLTPVTILGTYFCILAADFYSQEENAKYPPARWTTVSLLIMVAILIFGYYMWMYISLRYHFRVWFYWWQRNATVRLLLHQADENTSSHSNTTSKGLRSSHRQAHTSIVEIEPEDNVRQHPILQPLQNYVAIGQYSSSLQMLAYDGIDVILAKPHACSPNSRVNSDTNPNITTIKTRVPALQ